MSHPFHKPSIARTVIRTYSDTGQRTLYVDYDDGSRTECPAREVKRNGHIMALLAKAKREGVRLERELWA